MKKEYVIIRIDASPDGSPSVVISLSSAKDLKENNGPPSSPSGTNVMGFSSMDDLVKGMNKMMPGGMGMQGNLTSLKLDMHEYKEMGLAVGDKVYLEMTKAESSGV